MMKKAIGAAAALALALTAGAASAVEREGAWTVSPMIGLHWYDNVAVEDDDTVYSLGIGHNFSRNWSVEALLSYSKVDLRGGAGEVDTNIATISGLYHFDKGDALVPYLGGGIGYRNMDPQGGDDDGDSLINLAAGLKYFLTPQVALRLDGRYLLDMGDDNDDDYQLQAGLQLLFGVPKAMAAAPLDSDGDGVTDDKDRCPNTPKGVAVGADGCPLDSDGDGVPDSFDHCPNTPKGAPVDSRGCPLDSDGDGVPDYLDKCPNTPLGTKVDAQGCPVMMAPTRMELKIEFDFDKSDIRPQYHALLGDAAAFMEQHPGSVATIEGHTDSTGPDSYNQKLSERRADSVRDYLVNKKKIDANRLKTVGYGETRPIADNASKDGRQRNRRVIAVIIETK